MRIDEKVEAEFLASILQGRNAVDTEVLNVLEPGYFTVESYQWITKLLKEREWKPFAVGYLDQELLSIPDEQKRSQHRIQISRLYDLELTFIEDASKKFREYISYCIVNSTIRLSAENFSRSGRVDFLLRDIGKGISDAGDLMDENSLELVDYAEGYEKRQEIRRIRRDDPTTNPRILTGIPGLDAQFRIKAPMIIDFMAPFKRYKSIVLNAMGFSSLLQGFDVMQVTYENSVELQFDRYDSMFSGLNFARIANMLITPEEKEMLDRMFEWMRTWRSRLKVIKAEPKKTTVKDIEEKLLRVADKTGWRPEIEIWDYLNLINPSKVHREERLEQGQVVWDLKNHADKFNVPIIEASQTKMEGVTSDRLDMSHRGKSIDISQGINMSIAIDQTQQEKDDGIIVLSPLFARESKITIPEIILDSDISRMQVDRSLYKMWNHAVKVHPYLKS